MKDLMPRQTGTFNFHEVLRVSVKLRVVGELQVRAWDM